MSEKTEEKPKKKGKLGKLLMLGGAFVVLVGGLTLLRGGRGKTAEVRRREPLDLRGDRATSTT